MASNYPSLGPDNNLSEPLVQNPPSGSTPTGQKSSSKACLFIVLFVVAALLGVLAFFFVLRKDPNQVTAQIKFGASEGFSSLPAISEYEEAKGKYTFSSDNKYLAYTTKDKNVKVWDIQTKTLLAEFKNQNNASDDKVVSLTFMSENKTILMCTYRGFLQIWDLSTKAEVFKNKFPYEVRSLEVTKDFKKAVLGVNDTIQVWSFDTQKVEREIKVPNIVVPDIALSSDNQFVAAIDMEGIVYVWSFETVAKVSQLNYGKVGTRVEFTHDSKYVLATGVGSRIKIWNIATQALVAEVVHDDDINSIVISSDSKYLVSGSDDKTVKITEIETGALAGYFLHAEEVKAVAISRANRYLISADESEHLKVVNLETKAQVIDTDIDETLVSLKLSSDQGYLVGADDDGELNLWKIVP